MKKNSIWYKLNMFQQMVLYKSGEESDPANPQGQYTRGFLSYSFPDIVEHWQRYLKWRNSLPERGLLGHNVQATNQAYTDLRAWEHEYGVTIEIY